MLPWEIKLFIYVAIGDQVIFICCHGRSSYLYMTICCHWRSSYLYMLPWEIKLFTYVAIGDQVIKLGGGIPLTGLTQQYCCACPKPRPGFPTSYVVVFSVLSELRWEGIVHFVNIRGIDDHHCLNILFIIRKPFDYFFHRNTEILFIHKNQFFVLLVLQLIPKLYESNNYNIY